MIIGLNFEGFESSTKWNSSNHHVISQGRRLIAVETSFSTLDAKLGQFQVSRSGTLVECSIAELHEPLQVYAAATSGNPPGYHFFIEMIRLGVVASAEARLAKQLVQ